MSDDDAYSDASAEGAAFDSLFTDEEYTECVLVLPRHHPHRSVAHADRHELTVSALQTAAPDYDRTGQIVWPGSRLLCAYLATIPTLLRGRRVIELGSGAGVAGIYASKLIAAAGSGSSDADTPRHPRVVLTDHNDIVLRLLKRNVAANTSAGEGREAKVGVSVRRLDWGSTEDIDGVLREAVRWRRCFAAHTRPALHARVRATHTACDARTGWRI